ncbi:MAG: hypothetical protein AB8B82_09105 [Roseovarius sp.]
MTNTKLGQLTKLSDVLYETERVKLHRVIEQESKLRWDLARLDAARDNGSTLPTAEMDMLRRVGADVQWQAWLGRKRAELNRQLALVLAQKEIMMPKLRLAYGRKMAADHILTVQLQQDQRVQRADELSENQKFALLREMQNRRQAN